MTSGHPSPEALLRQVRATAEGFEVFGELGRNGDADVWYLGREEGATTLVALRLWRRGGDSGGPPVYSLEVARELDDSVARGAGACPACGAGVRAWARFCGKCGTDLAGLAAAPADPAERRALLAQVREAAGGAYEVLGEMPWGGGVGIVYFALEKATGLLVQLRLRPEGEGMALGETHVTVPLDRLQAGYVTQTALPPLPPPADADAPSAPAQPPGPGASVPWRRVGLIAGLAVALAAAAYLLWSRT